jgi:hypothetical protein
MNNIDLKESVNFATIQYFKSPIFWITRGR